jgi:hypothetical protein
VLQDIKLLFDSLGSKYSFLPSSTLALVIGFFGLSISFISFVLSVGIGFNPAFLASSIRDADSIEVATSEITTAFLLIILPFEFYFLR